MATFDGNNIITCSLDVKYHLYLNDCINATDLNILYINTQSIRNKLYDVELMINSLKCKTSIIVVTELWLREEENQFFNLNNYNPFFCNRSAGYGGTAIYVRNGISAVKLFHIDNDYCQMLGIKLVEKNINIISVYRSQKNHILNFYPMLEKVLTENKRSFFIGDFNVNLLNDNENEIITYKEIVNSYGYAFVNKISREYVTRVRNSIGTLIDHVVTDMLKFKYDFSLADTHLSDHKLMYFRISDLKPSKPPSVVDLTVLQYEAILHDPGWANASKASTVAILIDELSSIVKRNTKVIRKKINPNRCNGWMTQEIRNLMMERDRFFKYKKRYPQNSYIVERHLELSKAVATKIKHAKRSFNSVNIEQTVNNPKHLWRYLKQIIFNRSTENNSPFYIKFQNSLLKDPTEIANCFNSYFATIASNITDHLSPPTDNDFNYLNYNLVESFVLHPVTTLEIREIVANLNQNSATGLDGVSLKFIKYCMSYIENIVVDLINKCFRLGIFPDVLKTAKIIPIYKSGNALDRSNYRPIAILFAISKIYEKAIAERFENFLFKNNIISERQFGFSKNSSTTAAAMSLTDFLSNAFDKREYCACIFIDIRRAFDSIHHTILLTKLKKLGLTTTQLKLFETYITDRRQVVTIDNKNSSEQKMAKGVPQGSILGPCIFRFYINDMCWENLNGTLQLYADDGVVMYSANSMQELYAQMQQDLDSLKLWFDKNHLALNQEKTKVLLFENKFLDADVLNACLVTYSAFVIERVTKFTYLGLTIDSKMNWVNHINEIKKSITPYIFAINRTKHLLSKKCLLLMYNAYIQSRLTYLNAIWNGSAKYKMHELRILQKRVLKYIIHVPVRYPTILLDQQFISLEILSVKELLVLTYKILNNLIKHNFKISTVGEIHDYPTRRRSHYQIKFFSTNARNNNILFRGLSKYNELPGDIRHAISLTIFKQKLIKHLRQV